MMFLFYCISIFLTKVLPLKVCYRVAEFLAGIYYSRFSGEDKEALKANLRVVIGADAEESEIDGHVLKVFVNFAKHIVDFFKFQNLTAYRLDKYIEISGRQYLEEAAAYGKGVILLSAHLGSWELGGAAVAALGYPVNAIVLEHEDKRVNYFFANQRRKNRVKGIPIGMKIKKCFSVLRAGEMLAIVADKDYSGSVELVDFFGEKAYMPKGAAAISLRTGAPVVIALMTRKEDDTFHLSFDKPMIFDSAGDNAVDIRNAMGRYLKEMEEHIREYPDQWYVFERLWKQDQITQ